MTILVSNAALAQEPSSSFKGFYVGGHAGYGQVLEDGAEGTNGIVGGVHGGYNYQSGALVAGIEGDYDDTDISDSETVAGLPASVSIGYLASVRGRLGYATHNTLFYATAGYAWSNFEVSVTDGVDTLEGTLDLDGVVAGGGVEYKFSKLLSGRVEGLHYWLEGPNSVEAATGVVRAGLTLHIPN
ncbi:MAG: outer membrane beta-barrel protein [Hyphomicrobium sp.]